jgi:quercetin dioxygenase-like cupin family protein
MKIRSKKTTDEDPSIPTRSGFEGMHLWWLLSKDTSDTPGVITGISEFSPGVGHGLHRHDGFREILYIEQGSGVAFTDTEIFRAGAGDMVTFDPGEWHGYVNDSAETSTRMAFFYYGADDYSEIPYEEWDDWRVRFDELRTNNPSV